MSHTILAIDDSPTILSQLNACLAPEGYNVLEAHNGRLALDVVATQQVDLVIVDVNMPEMNGIEFLEAFRNLPEHDKTPVLFLTTESSAELREKGRSLRASAWVVKPFKPAVLVGGIQRLLKTAA